MELSQQQKNKLIVGIIAFILIAVAIVVGVFQKQKFDDLDTLADVARIRSALTLSYSINNHFPVAAKPVVVPSVADKTEKLCSTGFYGTQEPCEKILLAPIPTSSFLNPSFTYSTDNKGLTYQFEFNLRTTHRTLGLTKGVICARESGLSLGSCNQ